MAPTQYHRLCCLTIGLLLLLCDFGRVRGQDYDDWIKAVDTLGDSVTFQCSEYPNHPQPNVENDLDWDTVIPENWTITGWMLPNLDIIPIDFSDTVYTVMNDGWNMTIINVTTAQFGVYHCMLLNETGGYFLIKWGLNMRGPYFEDLWDKYEDNTFIGLGAMFGFLLIAASIYLTYAYRWVPTPEYLAGVEAEKEAIAKANAFNKATDYGTVMPPGDNVDLQAYYDKVSLGKTSSRASSPGRNKVVPVAAAGENNVIHRNTATAAVADTPGEFAYSNPVAVEVMDSAI